MKTHHAIRNLVLTSLALSATAGAGTLSYRPIPATESDLRAGFVRGRNYTSAVAAGKDDAFQINGVPMKPLVASGNSSTADHVSVGVENGSLATLRRESSEVSADGRMADLFASGITSRDGDGEVTEMFVVASPKGLVAGKTYEMRVYLTAWSDRERNVRLAFAGDGKEAVSTGFFNEDDATTSPGNFKDSKQAYYINYRYKWDGENTPGFTVTQKSGRAPFVFYGLTNHEVTTDEIDAQPNTGRTRVTKPGTTRTRIVEEPDLPPPPRPRPGTFPFPPGLDRPDFPDSDRPSGFPPIPFVKPGKRGNPQSGPGGFQPPSQGGNVSPPQNLPPQTKPSGPPSTKHNQAPPPTNNNPPQQPPSGKGKGKSAPTLPPTQPASNPVAPRLPPGMTPPTKSLQPPAFQPPSQPQGKGKGRPGATPTPFPPRP